MRFITKRLIYIHRALTFLIRPPISGGITPALICGVIVLIVGFVDWLTGTQVSLSIFYLIAVALAVAWLLSLIHI